MKRGGRGYDGARRILCRIQPRRLGNGHIIFSTHSARQEEREQASLIQAYLRYHMRLLKALQSRVGRERDSG
jgi:hypothetical protein